MGRVSAIVFGASVMLAAASGFAQVVPFPPELQNRIPAPLLPPPPPIINGPLGESPPPGVYHPPQLDTFADRTTRCLHEGASYGLRGRRLNAYTSRCANAN